MPCCVFMVSWQSHLEREDQWCQQDRHDACQYDQWKAESHVIHETVAAWSVDHEVRGVSHGCHEACADTHHQCEYKWQGVHTEVLGQAHGNGEHQDSCSIRSDQLGDDRGNDKQNDQHSGVAEVESMGGIDQSRRDACRGGALRRPQQRMKPNPEPSCRASPRR